MKNCENSVEERENGNRYEASSTWQIPLPADEIARQEATRSRLQPGMEVELRSLGKFIYGGVWDTMHQFFPAGGVMSADIETGALASYVKRDLYGRRHLQLPYTLLADYVIFF